jgi:hypothetical protein
MGLNGPRQHALNGTTSPVTEWTSLDEDEIQMQQKADEVEERAKKEAEEKAKAAARKAQGIAARAKRKPGKGPRKPRKTTPRDPISVSVSEALTLVPIGRTALFAALQDGTIKSCLRFGVRAIDYRSLKEAFAPMES